jgi:hypothetical protein
MRWVREQSVDFARWMEGVEAERWSGVFSSARECEVSGFDVGLWRCMGSVTEEESGQVDFGDVHRVGVLVYSQSVVVDECCYDGHDVQLFG